MTQTADGGPAADAPVLPGAPARAGVFAVVLAVVVMSGGSTLVRSADTPGPVVAFWRLVAATTVWYLIGRFRGQRIPKGTWRRVAPTGLLFGLDLCLFFSAVMLTRIAAVEFIGTLTPILVVPGAALLLGERVSRRTIVLGAVALAGIAVVVLGAPSGGHDSWVGNLLAAFALVAWSGYLLSSKRVRQHVDTGAFMVMSTATAMLAVLPVALASRTFLGPNLPHRHLGFSVRGLFDVPLHGWAVIAGLAVVTGLVGHGIVAWAQRRVPVSTIALVQVAQPALSTTWAYLALGEAVRPVQFAGMAVVLVAVGLIVLQSSGTDPVRRPLRR